MASKKRCTVVSTGNLNVSGVQPMDQSGSSANCYSSEVLKGVVAYVDRKFENDQHALDIIDLLLILGAKVENSFNLKVTHLVFSDGFLKTYQTAKERQIPMVTSKWVVDCHLANKRLDTADYPPEDIEKYLTPRKENWIYEKFHHTSSINQESNLEQSNDRMDIETLHKNVINLRDKMSDYLERELPTLRKTPKNPDKVLKGLKKCLYNIMNEEDQYNLYKNEEIDENNIPFAIRSLRKYLTPEGIEKKKTPSEIDKDLTAMEKEMKFNPQARQRFRRLLLNNNKHLNTGSTSSDFSTKKSRKSLLLSHPHTNFQTPCTSTDNREDIETIAFSGFTKSEIKTIKLSTQKLNINVSFHNTVEPWTTYLITKSPHERTLTMVYAMAYGVKIVSEEWLHASCKDGRLLQYDRYFQPGLSEPVKNFQSHRESTKYLVKFRIFGAAGSIYVAKSCEPSAAHLRRLLRACCGKCTETESKASLVIGKTLQMNEKNIKESWVLDSITAGKMLDKDLYLYDNL